MNDDSPIPPSSPNDSTPVGPNSSAHGGGNENSGIQFPSSSDPFWSASEDAQLDWYLDRKAEQGFQQELNRHIHETHGDDFPEFLKNVLSRVAQWMIRDQPGAFDALRHGNPEVATRAIQEATKEIQKVSADYRDHHKPYASVDEVIDELGPKADPQRGLRHLRAQAEPLRGRSATRPDKRTLDQLIQDLGDKRLSDDQAFGRVYASNRANR